MKNSPEYISELKENEIFVFGSNLLGIHGKGAALTAKKKFGAIQEQGEGLQGKSYAIPTKLHWRDKEGLSLPEIFYHIDKFCMFAADNPNLNFLVTPIGCGYAGYTPAEIAPLFKQAMKYPQPRPDNIYLPESFIKIING